MWRRGLLALIVAGSALLAVPAAASAQPVAQSAVAEGDPVVVSLGDSYISGMAGRWAGNSIDFLFDRGGTDRAWYRPSGHLLGTIDRTRVYGPTAKNGCFRSDSAPIASAVNVAGLNLGRPVNLACSGAQTFNLLRASAGGVGQNGELPQNDQLAALARTSRVKLVTISIGGNDIKFPELVIRCIAAYATNDKPCKTREQAGLDAALPAMGQAVGAVLDDVRDTLAGAGYAAGDYQLVLQSYPNPLPTADKDKYPDGWGSFKYSGGHCPFLDPDETWSVNTATPSITSTLRAAAQQHGASFLDLSKAFDGHELCAAGTSHPLGTPKAADNEWVRYVDYNGQGDPGESMHPNYFGQQAIGTCLARAVELGGDTACTGTPKAGLDGLQVSRS